MKKILIAAAFLGGLATSEVAAQKYLGLSNSNYSGIYGSQYNPAKLADQRVKFAFNLVSANLMLDNDFYKFKGIKAFENLDLNSIGNDATFGNTATMSVGTITELLGPSFQFTVNDRLGFGFSSRVRVFGQGHQIDSNFMRILNNNFDTTQKLTSNNPFGTNINALSDLGIGGSYAVVDNDRVRLSLGASAKMYRGVVANAFSSNNYDVWYNHNAAIPSNSTISVNNIDWDLFTSLNTGKNVDNLFDNNPLSSVFGSDAKGKGFGGDVGAEFSIKDITGNKPYIIKFGAAVHDIGKIKYNNIQQIKVTGAGAIIEPDKIDISDINATADYLASRGLTVVRNNNASRTVSLPTNLNVYADYAINKRFFVSANGVVDLVSDKKVNPHYYNFVNITPRMETKWFDVAVPLTYNFMSQDFKPGLAFRIGPLSVGSDDLKVLVGNAKGANVYAGLGFLLYKPKKEQPIVEGDMDADGVLDKDDACPTVAGPAENKGCPWEDTDKDGVIDRNDACPNQAGPAENNGCPWPDTDGDGVYDKDDKCPNQFGLKEYQGCPKPKEVIATEATGALKDIIFDFNKATISAVSNEKLDQAAQLIKAAPDGTFLVTGHTDKKGNPNYNLKLSRERAASVVKALEARGVAESQLKSVGVGARDAQVPATASNEERAIDRKVVVEAVNGPAWEALKKSDLPVVKKKTVTTKKKVAPKKKK